MRAVRRLVVPVTAFLLAITPLAPTAAGALTLDLVASAGLSPNHDGHFDVARISLATSGPADVTVLIARRDGSTVRTFTQGAPVDGHARFTWAGRNDAGERVSDARYRVVVTAEGPGGEVRQRAPIVLDTRAPSFRWRGIAPEPLRTANPVRFTFATRDRFSDRVSVSFVVTDAERRLVERVRSGTRLTGRRTVSWDARAPGSHLVAPGLYGVAVGVRDELGNARIGRLRPFRDHRPVRSTALRHVDGAGRRVALTFDDCTYDGAWRRILGALHAAHGAATFFCAGINVSQDGPLARRTVASGNAIGSHTWNHLNLIGASESAVRRAVRRDQAVWWSRARATPAPLFRPPDGEIGATTLAGVGGEGFSWTVLWDVDPRDWSGISSTEIERRVLSSVRPGSIVVLHVKPRTAAAIAGILAGLRARRLEPVSLPALLRAGGLTR